MEFIGVDLGNQVSIEFVQHPLQCATPFGGCAAGFRRFRATCAEQSAKLHMVRISDRPSEARANRGLGRAICSWGKAGRRRLRRCCTLKAVEGLTREQLDHLHDERSNSIGALLAHVAAVERGYQRVTFDEREPTAAENDAWSAALKLGEKGRRDIRGHELQFYVDELRRTREETLAGLAARDDAWLEAPLRIARNLNAHWAWFHVAEEEINHRGQIRWLRVRLPTPIRVAG